MERLHALSEATRAFADATPDYGRLLETVAERMGRVLGAGCIMGILSDDGTHIVPPAVSFSDVSSQVVAKRILNAGSFAWKA